MSKSGLVNAESSLPVEKFRCIQPEVPAPDAWAARITACWRRSLEAIIEVGRLLAAAKEALPYGEFGAMIETALPFSASTAQRLMAIAADARLTNPAHVQHLPPHWGTLYELTKLDDSQFEAKLSDGTIHPEMRRRAVVRINGARSLMGSRIEPRQSRLFPNAALGHARSWSTSLQFLGSSLM